MASTVRSLLFVPGHQGARFDKACQSGADAIVLDLEDAVPVDRKDEARAQVAQWLAGRTKGIAGPQIAVRVNATDTSWHPDDIALCASAGVDALMLPKSEDPTVLRAIAEKLPAIALLPLVETARGMARLEEIAAAPGVQRLVFGTIDFQADLDIEGEGLELLYFRSRMVLASRVAGIQSPVDGVSTSIDDAARIEADALQARAIGLWRQAVHPSEAGCDGQPGLFADAGSDRLGPPRDRGRCRKRRRAGGSGREDGRPAGGAQGAVDPAGCLAALGGGSG